MLEGTAVVYASYQYWNEWAKYLGVKDPQEMAKFLKHGIMVFKSEANIINRYLSLEKP